MSRSRISPLVEALVVCMLVLVWPAYAQAFEAKPFGFEKFSLSTTSTTEVIEEGTKSEEGGILCSPCRVVNVPANPPFTQAGGHPWALTSDIRFDSEQLASGEFAPTGDPKDVFVDLPPGLLGDPQAVPQCPRAVMLSGSCPTDTQLGVAKIQFMGTKAHVTTQVGPLVNLVPEAGQSAEFGLELPQAANFILTAHLTRTPDGVYTVTVGENGITVVGLLEVELTFWGVPADPSHDRMRGMFCGQVVGSLQCKGGRERSGVSPVPFLSMSTDCSAGPERTFIRADSWEEPGTVSNHEYSQQFVQKSVTMPAVTGCGLVQFLPGTGIEFQPETREADAPTGAAVNLSIPQAETPGAVASPQMREVKVTLPEGVSVSPGLVDGIRACEARGPEGIDIEGPESEETSLSGELQLAPGHCPAASRIGSATAVTPLLGAPVEGSVYLARPGCGGSGQASCTEQDALNGNLYRLYLELGGRGALGDAGINFKVPFNVEVNPATGQITTVVSGIMQAPVSEVSVQLNGGDRGALAMPAACEPITTTADFAPWSAPGFTPSMPGVPGTFVSGTADATPRSKPFDVTGCQSPQPFSPGLAAGTVTPNAGKFSAFTMNLSRNDREQYIKGIQVHTPPGLLGLLSSIALCGEPAADRGECGEGSLIGSTRVASGAGNHPFEIEGKIYLTGPYDGAPFGLSIVVPVIAGPFNLGKKIVRARVNVDPSDSSLTVTTDETGPYAVPQIVFGVPVRLKRVSVNIDRPGFMFNPTNCNAQQVTAAISGTGQTVANVSSPFAVGGCNRLAFTPTFTVSSSGHTTRQTGASLDVKLSYPKDAMGKDANIARVKVSLPKQLPSYLPTLQKACLAATFNANPAGCPPGSIVGIARAVTPLLPVGLSGPVYFVSHGGEEFPSLIIVLQGDGVRVDLTGATFIDKAGITSSTFKTIPDVPVDSFELFLPQGENHALAANTNLCTAATPRTITVKHRVVKRVHGRKVQRVVSKRVKTGGLVMPTEFVAQNGAVFKQNTKIAVTGCTSPKRARTARRAARTGHVSATHSARSNGR